MTYMAYESVRVDRLTKGDLLVRDPLDGDAVVIGEVQWVSQGRSLPGAPMLSYEVCWVERNWDGQGNDRSRYFTKIGAAIVLTAPKVAP